MQISKYEDRHYPDMAKTWQRYGWPPCPKDGLPRKGYVAYQDSVFVAYLGMYEDTGRMGFIDWALKNPEARREDSELAFREMFSRLKAEAEADGCRFIFSMTKTEPWQRKLVSYGMQVAEVGATTFIMALGGGDTAFIRD